MAGLFMTKLAAEFGGSKSKATACMHSFRDALVASAKEAKNGKIPIAGFGTFRTVDLPARKVRNPKTNAQIDAPAKRVVRFKMSSKLLTPTVKVVKAAKPSAKKK